MNSVKVNGKIPFQIDVTPNAISVDEQEVALDITQLSAAEFNVLHEHKSFHTEIIEFNKAEKTCKVKVNGNVYEVSIEDQYDQLLKQLGLDSLLENKVSEVKAPMPGLVLKVSVEENATVKKGDNLLVLEAMKMENMLKSPADGIIKRIEIQQGDKVEKNQVLITFK